MLNEQDQLRFMQRQVSTLAAKAGTTPLEVPLTQIHALLREHGQIVPAKA